LALNIESLQNFAKKFKKFQQKLKFQNIDKSENIGEHSICHFSTNFWGAGKLLKEEAKYCQKFWQNVVKIL